MAEATKKRVLELPHYEVLTFVAGPICPMSMILQASAACLAAFDSPQLAAAVLGEEVHILSKLYSDVKAC